LSLALSPSFGGEGERIFFLHHDLSMFMCVTKSKSKFAKKKNVGEIKDVSAETIGE